VGLKALADMLLSATDDGEGTSTVPVSAITLHAFGAQIGRIADGESAKAVLTPGRPGRRSEEGRNYACALVYWRHRVEHPADRDGAVRRAHGKFPDVPAGSIERYARKWRDVILERLPVAEYRRAADGSVTRIASGIETAALVKYLAKKSKRGRS
jgi:hypothetical protein